MLRHISTTFSIGAIILYEKIIHSLGYTDTTTYVRNLVNKCSQYNVLCVKITQSMMGFGMFPPEFVEVFKQNTHSVNVNEDEIDIITLNKIKQEYNIELPEKHFHAGMIAVVYLGTMNGKKVIVKLRRNNIAERIRASCEHLFFLYNIIERASVFSKQLKTILLSLQTITHTSDYLISQCNFDCEIDAMRKSKEEVDNYPQILQNIVIPVVYNKPDDITDTGFIIMEYLDGVFSNDLTDMDERKQYLEDLIKYDVLMGWFFTYFHTDIHCGNVIYMKQEGQLKVGLIDFGMVIKTTEYMKDGLRLIGDIHQKRVPYDECYRCINHIFKDKIDLGKITDEQKEHANTKIKLLIDATAKNELTEQLFLTLIDEVCEILNKRLIIDLEMFLILISTTMLNSTLKVLAGYDASLIERLFNKVLLDISE